VRQIIGRIFARITGSIPVSRTNITAVQAWYLALRSEFRAQDMPNHGDTRIDSTSADHGEGRRPRHACPEDLTIEELRAIETVIRGAIDSRIQARSAT
jgi:hypothetical protein